MKVYMVKEIDKFDEKNISVYATLKGAYKAIKRMVRHLNMFYKDKEYKIMQISRVDNTHIFELNWQYFLLPHKLIIQELELTE